jgi:Ser/Thr protein kinase RdoA (MazF antagonist)
MEFGTLSTRAQVARLRPVAEEALSRYPVDVRSLRLLQHGFNTIFRVDAKAGEKYALRLNVNSKRTAANLAAEAEWLWALGEETDIWVPVPQRTHDGALTTSVWSPDVGRNIDAVLFSWLPGKDLGDVPSTRQMGEVGRTLAVLHRHGATWRPHGDAAFPVLDRPYWDLPDRLTGQDSPLTAAQIDVVSRVMEGVSQVVAELFAQGVAQPIHADPHNWNMKWYRGRLSLFDFDDSAVGPPVFDLAIATYYLRPQQESADALIEGYLGESPLPVYTTDEFEALVAHRNVLLLNDLLSTLHSGHRALLPRYIANTEIKLRAFLDTGIYRHDVDGVVPLED